MVMVPCTPHTIGVSNSTYTLLTSQANWKWLKTMNESSEQAVWEINSNNSWLAWLLARGYK